MLPDLLSVWHRITALARRRRIRREVDEELAFHLAMRQADEARAGLEPAAAQRAARRRLGNPAALAEETRDMWSFPSLESIGKDIRFALRSLRKAPGFAVVVVVTLAVAIGANTAIFSLVNATLLRGLPYPEADRLMLLIGTVQRQTAERRFASYPDFLDWRAQATAFAGMAAYDGISTTMTDGSEPERITIEAVSAAYFDVLDVPPSRGRGFRADEDLVEGRHPVAVISHGLWERRYGADPDVIGRTIRLGTTAFEVIGIAPPGFAGLTDAAELWIPFTMANFPLENRGTRWFAVVARLAPGVTPEEARTELDVIARRLEEAHPRTNEQRRVEVSPLYAETFGLISPALLALMAAVGCVLLIGCANVANLLVGRSEARRHEIAIRTALGAGRLRLLRQLVTESLVLAAIGGLAGISLAHLAVRLLLLASPIALPSFVEPGLDSTVLLFTAAVTLACGVVVGLAPALHARSGGLGQGLKTAARGSSPQASRLRGALVVAEFSLAVVLVVAAGLMIRTFRNITNVDPGFETERLLTLNVSTPRGQAAPGSPPDAPPPFVVSWRELLERVAAAPGVSSVSLSSDVPLQGGGSAIFYTAEGDTTTAAETRPRAYVHRVTPGFFDTMGMPLLHGRTFEPGELTADSSAVIVSESVGRRFWPGLDPIGRRIKPGGPESSAPWLTIVGVVPDVKYRSLPANPTRDPDLYFPYAERGVHALMVRTEGDPAVAAPGVRHAVRSLSERAVVYNLSPMRDSVDTWTARSRFTSWLMGAFAGTALLLAVIGIYGVMSYLVAQRTREFGIRLALGARPSAIVRGVFRQGAPLIAAGLIVGTAGAAGASRWMETLLFGVSAASPSSFAPILLLGAVALLACAVPALRASRVDPVDALRVE